MNYIQEFFKSLCNHKHEKLIHRSEINVLNTILITSLIIKLIFSILIHSKNLFLKQNVLLNDVISILISDTI
jgi:hypothetical protein